MARKQYRRLKWRSWSLNSRYGLVWVGIWLTVFFPIVFTGLVLSRQILKADETRKWMIPGRVVLGLSKDRTKPYGDQLVNDWRPDLPETAWQFLIIHHSASESGSVKTIHEEHKRRKDSAGNSWLGIGYHFVIGNGLGMEDGAVEATFRWNEQLHGAHSGDAMFNARGIGICLIGNFEKGPPTTAQWESVRKLVKTLADRHRIARENLIGHASVKATACPGKHFPLKELRTVIPEARL